MNIAVIGAGEVGFHLADILSREGHRVSVVDSDPSKSRRLMESLDVQVVVGDGTRAEVLNTAGVSKADLAVCVTDADRLARRRGHDEGLFLGPLLAPRNSGEEATEQAAEARAVIRRALASAVFVVSPVHQWNRLRSSSSSRTRLRSRRSSW